MAGSSVAAMVARPTRPLADILGMPNLELMIPSEFGSWRIDKDTPVILPAPDVQAQLDKIYNQVLARTYVDPTGQRIMLSVAYGGDQSDATSAHRPEVCYPAQGFAILSNEADALSLDGRPLPVRRLVSKLGAREEPITYWIVVGDQVVTTGVGQKLAQIHYGVRGIIADGMLVRVSSIDTDPEHAFAAQSRFVRELAKVINPHVKARVFGLRS